MEQGEGGLAPTDRPPRRQAYDRGFVEREHEAKVLGEPGEERNLGRARVAEDRRQPLLPQDVEGRVTNGPAAHAASIPQPKVRYENIRSHAGYRPGAKSGLRSVARARAGRDQGVRGRDPGAAAERRRPRHRAHPRGGAPVPADARTARLRAPGGHRVLAPPTRARARLRVPLGAQPARGRACRTWSRSSPR